MAKLLEAMSGFILLPRRRVVEHSSAWAAGFHRLARGYERQPETLAGLRFLALAIVMLRKLAHLMARSA